MMIAGPRLDGGGRERAREPDAAVLRRARTGEAFAAALLGLLSLCLTSCSEDRKVEDQPGGIHPPGWADVRPENRQNPSFHANDLVATKFPLARCQACHGGDYGGGPTRVSCSQGSCHAKPPSDCTTCHGSNGTPRPATGAHQAHNPYCDTCHHVPTPDEVEKHASGGFTRIQFGGLALRSNSAPTYDPQSHVCANTYCHGAASPPWIGGNKLDCSGCHGAPPPSHQRWARVVKGPESCVTCHPAPTDPRHRNGAVDLLDNISCNACHGSEGKPNPPPALDGATDPTNRVVGAHVRHTDPTLADRIGHAVACETCHVVPASVGAPGHLDQTQPRVRFVGPGTYDANTSTCTVWCHWNKAAVWTNNSGSARTCGACHAFPPVTTRAGTPHPSVPPDLAACRICHPFAPTTHIDGVVEFLP